MYEATTRPCIELNSDKVLNISSVQSILLASAEKAESSEGCSTICLPTNWMFPFVNPFLQLKTHNQNDWSVKNQIEHIGLRQKSSLYSLKI